MISLFLTLASLISMIQSIQKTPTVMFMDENSLSVTDIYFPSVTFCQTLRLDFESEYDEFDYYGIERKIRYNEIGLKDLTELEYILL